MVTNNRRPELLPMNVRTLLKQKKAKKTKAKTKKAENELAFKLYRIVCSNSTFMNVTDC